MIRAALLARCAVLLVLAAPASAQSDLDRPSTARRAGDIAATPLRDTNIVKTKIPPELAAIEAAPYSARGLETCPSIAFEVARLNKVLGRDVDSGGSGTKRSMGSQLAEQGTRDAIGSLIPGRGLVRLVTGADAAQRRAAAAVNAGNVRRGFLKGYGLAKGCRAPAAPAG